SPSPASTWPRRRAAPDGLGQGPPARSSRRSLVGIARRPRSRTARLRLTLLYGGLFLLSGAPLGEPPVAWPQAVGDPAAPVPKGPPAGAARPGRLVDPSGGSPWPARTSPTVLFGDIGTGRGSPTSCRPAAAPSGGATAGAR